jgi:hypothetical protein
MAANLSNPDVITAVVGLIVAITALVKIMTQERQLRLIERRSTQTLAVVAKHEGMLNGTPRPSSPVLPSSSGDVQGDLETSSPRIGDVGA